MAENSANNLRLWKVARSLLCDAAPAAPHSPLTPQVLHPGVGSGTCLVVTDIQNSTHLWESLPHNVMDSAVRTHHEVLRGLLRKHKGYEPCTEVSVSPLQVGLVGKIALSWNVSSKLQGAAQSGIDGRAIK